MGYKEERLGLRKMEASGEKYSSVRDKDSPQIPLVNLHMRTIMVSGLSRCLSPYPLTLTSSPPQILQTRLLALVGIPNPSGS